MCALVLWLQVSKFSRQFQPRSQFPRQPLSSGRSIFHWSRHDYLPPELHDCQSAYLLVWRLVDMTHTCGSPTHFDARLGYMRYFYLFGGIWKTMHIPRPIITKEEVKKGIYRYHLGTKGKMEQRKGNFLSLGQWWCFLIDWTNPTRVPAPNLMPFHIGIFFTNLLYAVTDQDQG